MRVLILGGGGMLGHKLAQCFRDHFDTWVTVRRSAEDYTRYGLVDRGRIVTNVDVSDFGTVIDAFAAAKPDAVVNCIGIIKQLSTASDPILNLTVNSLLPHRLQQLCRATGARLVHFSTDCVFSGRKGQYTEDDPSDAMDLYGRTKFLGETHGAAALTIRSSVIGRELSTRSGLVEWFLGQRDRRVKGYTRAIYSGFTTHAMARIVRLLLTDHPGLSGTVQVSSSPITKYDLLGLVREAYGLPIELEADEHVRIDRSLDSSRFRALTGFTPPAWSDMIAEMAADTTPYDEWRSRRG